MPRRAAFRSGADVHDACHDDPAVLPAPRVFTGATCPTTVKNNALVARSS